MTELAASWRRRPRLPGRVHLGSVDGRLPDRGRGGRRRPGPLGVGHLQPHARQSPRRRHRRHRLRLLPPLPRGRGAARLARPELLPLLHLLAAGPARRPGRRQPAGPGLLPRAARRARRARHRGHGHPLPLGPPAGTAGRGRLGESRHRRTVRRVRRPDRRGARRPGCPLDHPERAAGGLHQRLPQRRPRARAARRRRRGGRHPPPAARPRPGHPGAARGRRRRGRHHPGHASGPGARRATGSGRARAGPADHRRGDERHLPRAGAARPLPGARPAGPAPAARADRRRRPGHHQGSRSTSSA